MAKSKGQRHPLHDTQTNQVTEWLGRGFNGLLDLAEQWDSKGVPLHGDAIAQWVKARDRLARLVERLTGAAEGD